MHVLFVCNGNVARSQEAEAFFNKLSEGAGNTATSAGINVKIGKPIDPNVIEVMSEIGYDLSSAKRKYIDKSMVDSAHVIISFKAKEELPDYVLVHKNIMFWDVPDPQHQDLEFHRKVRDTVKANIEHLLTGTT
jgi:arsenate reductase